MPFDRDQVEGEEFQDFVKQTLWHDGIAIEFYSSRKYQVAEGEGPSGIEVKYDRRFRETGNFYIETEACLRGKYEPSGIYKNKGAWLMAMGDPEEFYIIQVSILQALDKTGRYRKADTKHQSDVPTRGFLLPVFDMRRYSGKRFARGKAVIKAPEDGEEKYRCPQCHQHADELVDGGTVCFACHENSKH